VGKLPKRQAEEWAAKVSPTLRNALIPVIPIPPIAYIVVSAERFAFLEYC
jgi:hypothetical protein